MQGKGNIAARAGRWSTRNRRKAVLGWLAFVLVAFMVGGFAGKKEMDQDKQGVGESGRAAEIQADGFPQDDEKAEEHVLLQSSELTAGGTEFRAAVADAARRLERTDHVQNVETPYEARPAAVSSDGHSALITYEIRGDSEQIGDRLDAPRRAIEQAAAAHPGMRIEPYGDASIQQAVTDTENEDFKKAEVSSLPLTLFILVLAFGALVAAGIPMLLALTGVLATMGLTQLISHLQPVASGIDSLILLVGLAVGVDYALFYLRRAREYRAAGHGVDAAVEAAAATSGRAVLVSGLTVAVSMGGMYLAGIPMFVSFATATIVVVLVSMVGALTVLPAVLSKLGDRVEKGRLPFHGRLKRSVTSIGIWSRITDRVLRRPALSAALAGGLLVALALPALGMNTSLPGTESMSRDIAVVKTWDRVQEAFPQESIPVIAVVRAGDVTAEPVRRAIGELEGRVAARGDLFEGRPTVETSDDRHVATISVPAAGDGTDDASNRALDEMRGTIVPETVGALDGTEVAVTGETAAIRDFNGSLKSHLPYVFAFVLSMAFILLLVTFRSIVIPLKAIVLNMLSVGAAYGLLVTVFQNGWGESLLGFESNGAVTAWLPPFLIVILFGLSMDYHVFILSRIREAVDRGMSTDEAVAQGIKSTAGVVTSAAVVMVGVFSLFATMSSLDMKQMGVGLAAAVLIDATIIRGVLLPASMKLLGERNWWLPRRLGWLPELRPEGEPAGA
ncbi:MAG TPA: MMPL family transporter [Thermoleophilaceae bacterium]